MGTSIYTIIGIALLCIGCIEALTFTLDTASIPENSPAGTVVQVLAATDGTDPVTYAIDGTPSEFSIANDNELQVAAGATFDLDTTATYTLTITATDAASATATATLTVSITEVTQILFSIDPTNPSFAEDTATGVSVAKVTPTGGSGEHTYTLVSQTPDSTPKKFAFSKDGENLQISVNDTLDFETTDNYRLIISVTEGSNPVLTGTATVDIQITDSNDAPVFSSATFTACVNQNSPEDTPVITVTATDQDDGDTISYSLTAGNEDGLFAISATGAITVAPDETVPATPTSYTLTVTATDNDDSPLSGTTDVTVTVGNPCSGSSASVVKDKLYIAFFFVAVAMLKFFSF